MKNISELSMIYQNAILQTSSYCDKHKRYMVKILRTGDVVCPKCLSEERQAFADERAQKAYDENEKRKRLYFLRDYSLMDDEIKNATFDNFNAETLEQIADLEFVKDRARDWIKGGKNNIILIGDTGVGKSHLAFAAIKAISDYNGKLATMVNVTDLFAKLKEDFKDEAETIKRLSEIDYLVLDDLGTEKTTEWSSGVLYSILNKRSNTLITTNLGPNELMRRYGKRIYSRLFKGVDEKQLHFMRNTKDKRIELWTN